MDDFLRRFSLCKFFQKCFWFLFHHVICNSVTRCNQHPFIGALQRGNLIFIASFQPIHTAASVRAAVFQGTFLTAIRRCLPMNQLPNFFLVQPVKNIAQQICRVIDELRAGIQRAVWCNRHLPKP